MNVLIVLQKMHLKGEENSMFRKMFRGLWKVTKFFIFYILLGPITLIFYVAKWIFKG